MISYLVGVGSSSQIAHSYIQQAYLALDKHKKIEALTASSVITNPGYGTKTHAIYANACFAVRTNYSPDQFWHELRLVEHRLGRIRAFHYAPRTIDLDILWSSIGKVKTNFLNIPHAEVLTRDFARLPALSVFKELGWPIPITWQQPYGRLSSCN